MRRTLSYNQLAGWNSHSEQLVFNEQESKLNDYYECLIECEDDQSSCKRICKEVLLWFCYHFLIPIHLSKNLIQKAPHLGGFLFDLLQSSYSFHT